MKLGALKSAIRDLDGPPRAWMNMPSEPPCAVPVYLGKTDFLKQLDEAYPGGRSQETGLELVRGFIKRVGETIEFPED
jgi:hypothetical protein